MAESVEEELKRKLVGAAEALKEVQDILARYSLEEEILIKRVTDLNIALSAFEYAVSSPPSLMGELNEFNN